MQWKGANTNLTLKIGDRKIAIATGTSAQPNIVWTLPYAASNLTVNPYTNNDIWAWKVNDFFTPSTLTVVPPSGGRLVINGTSLAINEGLVIPSGRMAVFVPIGPNNYAASLL